MKTLTRNYFFHKNLHLKKINQPPHFCAAWSWSWQFFFQPQTRMLWFHHQHLCLTSVFVGLVWLGRRDPSCWENPRTVCFWTTATTQVIPFERVFLKKNWNCAIFVPVKIGCFQVTWWKVVSLPGNTWLFRQPSSANWVHDPCQHLRIQEA